MVTMKQMRQKLPANHNLLDRHRNSTSYFDVDIPLKNILTKLHNQLRLKAKHHGWSLDKEVLAILESVGFSVPRTMEEL